MVPYLSALLTTRDLTAPKPRAPLREYGAASRIATTGKQEMRDCGDCRLCCKVLDIPELEKPAGVWCKHACDAGCAIYKQPERPEVCGTYECAWLTGYFEERHQPNRSKLVVGRKEPPDKNLSAWWTVNEALPGAANTRLGRQILKLLKEQSQDGIVIYPPEGGGRRLIMPYSREERFYDRKGERI